MKDDITTAYRAVAKYLPRPTGVKILLGIPRLERQTAGGLALPDEMIEREEAAGMIAKVLAMGPDAYKSLAGCSDPYCKVGDWVAMRPYSGTRFRVEQSEHEFRLVNDNTVEGVIEDPSFLMRAHSIVKMRRAA